MLAKCRALFVAKAHGAEMAAVLFEGEDRWHALMSIGARRLSDSATWSPTSEGARARAYLGIRTYLELMKDITLPLVDSLDWVAEPHPDQWIAAFYAKPLWPER
jgi:hypothetical protein